MKAIHFLALLVIILLAACGTQSTSSVAETTPDRTSTSAEAKPAAANARSGPFDQTLALAGITFRVSCPNDSSLNALTIESAGLEIDNTPIVRQADGIVVGAEIADLDANSSPEIYVYVQSAGSGSYGSLIAYAANNRKSLSEIYLPALADHSAATQGYMGHDEFAVVEDTLVRYFPIYRASDINAQPTGGTRQLQYKLVAGEAGWILRLDKVVEY